MKLASLILMLIVFQFSHTQTFNIVFHQVGQENTGPRCLDGSPAAIYIDVGAITDKFVLFFEGGGLCRGDGLNNMLDYCLQRSMTHLGSSKNYPEKTSFDQYVFMNPDSKINPLFHNWTRIFVPYCDGSLHLGFKSIPIEYKGKKLYFRGQNNTRAHFNYLHQKFNFFNASEIVISGTSAGAVATYQWGNYVYDSAQNKPEVYLMPDSGMFLSDFVNPWTNKTMSYYTSTLFEIVFTQTTLPSPQCPNKFTDIHDCFNAGNLHDILKPKTLVIQSTYDAWGLEQILGLRCLSYPVPSSIQNCNDTQRAYIEKYHQGLQQCIQNFTKEERHGIWAIGCVQHGFVDTVSSYQNEDYISPYPSGVTLEEAIKNFFRGEKVREIDASTWPGNKGCSGYKNYHLLRTMNS